MLPLATGNRCIARGIRLAHLSQLNPDFDDFRGVERRKCLIHKGSARQSACGGDLGPWRRGVGAGANVHQIGRFENAAGQGLATVPTIGRLRLNRRATGGSPTSYE